MLTVSDSAASSAAAVSSTAPVSDAAPMRVIFIDDDNCVRSLVVQFLRKRGYVAEGFGSGKAALGWMARNQCALAITDIMMGDTDGLEVIQHIRRTYPKTKIIAVSGGDSRGNSYLHAARQLGAANVISKPFTLAQLDAAVRQILGRE